MKFSWRLFYLFQTLTIQSQINFINREKKKEKEKIESRESHKEKEIINTTKESFTKDQQLKV